MKVLKEFIRKILEKNSIPGKIVKSQPPTYMLSLKSCHLKPIAYTAATEDSFNTGLNQTFAPQNVFNT